MSNQFFLTLLSNNSVDIYSNNVLSSFSNYLESPLNLYGSWEVGISEIFYNAFAPTIQIGDPDFARRVQEMSEQIEKLKEMLDNEYIDTSLLDSSILRATTAVDMEYSEMIYIHTDIIRPRIVGDQLVRCLKILPAKGKQQEYIRFGVIEYYPVELFYIRNISIMLLDSEAKKIDFNRSSLPTLLTLHFRKINI